MQSTAIRIPKRKLCAGDLKHSIHIKSRQAAGPSFNPITGTIDLSIREEFGELLDLEVFAAIKTLKGKTFYGKVGTDPITLTHEIYIYSDPRVTAESWVILDTLRYLDILNVQDLDETGRFMQLLCVDKGTGEASKA